MHIRTRFLSQILDKKRRTFPLVGVLGARQVGKSTLLRDLYGKANSIPYLTFDRPEALKEAKARSENFVLVNTNDFTTPIIIDEAHKAAAILDVLKVLSDEKKNRGIVLMTGSVDFSMARGIRETLTGRIGICRLYPMTIAELQQRQFVLTWQAVSRHRNETPLKAPTSSAEIERWLERGGMPAICKLRDRVERELLMEEWLQSVCYRDLLELKGANYDGALAREILSVVARQPTYSQAEIAKELGEDSRTVGKHLQGLEALFVIVRLRPFKQAGGTGFDRFYLFDAGIAAYLGASKTTGYMILTINELLAQHEYGSLGRAELYFYASRGKTKVDLVVKTKTETTAVVVSARDRINHYSLKSMNALIGSGTFPRITVLAPVSQPLQLDRQIKLLPFSALC